MGEREIARTMLELLETPPAGEVVTGKRWLPDVKYEKYVGMIRRASVASGIESKCQMRRERLIWPTNRR